MNITYACVECGKTTQSEMPEGTTELSCDQCGFVRELATEEFADHKLHACLICGCKELFARKDFSQKLGVMIVVIGFGLSTIAWGFHMRFVSYAILFLTALIDVALYFTVGNMFQCYRCHAEYRRLPDLAEFAPFDLTTHERFRQQALRMAQSKKV